MERDELRTKMVISTMASGKKARLAVTESLSTRPVLCTMVNGSMTCTTVKELSSGSITRSNTPVILLTARKLDKENLNLTAMFTKEILLMDNSTVRVNTTLQSPEKNTKENFKKITLKVKEP